MVKSLGFGRCPYRVCPRLKPIEVVLVSLWLSKLVDHRSLERFKSKTPVKTSNRSPGKYIPNKNQYGTFKKFYNRKKTVHHSKKNAGEREKRIVFFVDLRSRACHGRGFFF